MLLPSNIQGTDETVQRLYPIVNAGVSIRWCRWENLFKLAALSSSRDPVSPRVAFLLSSQILSVWSYCQAIPSDLVGIKGSFQEINESMMVLEIYRSMVENNIN